jgi:hypothetical protein
LIRIASQLIGEFWEDSRSLLFAPSTIAISAMIVAMSLCKIDSQSFSERLPDFFFPTSCNNERERERERESLTSSLSLSLSSSSSLLLFQAESGKLHYLDFASCLQVMERLPSIRSKSQPTSRSPVCVSDEAVL